MKKITVILLFTCLAAYFSEKSYAGEGSYYSWVMGGYGYSQSVDGSWSSKGPVKFTVGGLLWDYVGMELNIDTSWEEYNSNNTVWTLDFKPYILIQSTLGNRSNALIPYVGIAPLFAVSGVDSDINDTSFDLGVATKGGLRIRLLNALIFGIGIEYVFHNNNLSRARNMSQFNAVGEIGFSW